MSSIKIPIPSCDKCSKLFSTKQARDYHLSRNVCTIVNENPENNTILMSIQQDMKDLKHYVMSKSSSSNENDMIRLLKEEIRMLKEKEKDEIKGLKKEIELLKESHSIEIKTLKAKFQEKKEDKKEEKQEIKEEKKEVKKEQEVKEVKQEVKQEVKKEKDFIGGLTESACEAVKAHYEKTGEIRAPKGFINNKENINLLFKYVGYVAKKPIEEKKEEPKPDPMEEEEETDEDKAYGEYCEKDEYGIYHIGGIQSDSLWRLKDFYTNKIPKDLLFGDKKTKCSDKMDYLKREFSSKFSNDFSGTKANYEKLKFYLEN